jgi:uncharacterized protein YaiE (UPF0345 family)
VDDAGAKATNSITLTVNAPPSLSFLSPAGGAVFVAPATLVIEATASDVDGTVSQVAFFNGAASMGVDTTPPYRRTVGPLPPGAFTFIAIATDNRGARTTNSVSITVNDAPTIAITNPPSGAVFTSPATILVEATGSDSDGTITQVEFFKDSVSLAVDADSPYRVNVGPLSAGTYTVSAVATDNLGARATNAISVIVNNPPTVSITNPLSGAIFIAPASFLLEATASDSDGTISQVEFFNGTSALGASADPPYNVAVGPLPSGTFTFSIVATDNDGAKATNTIVVNVNARPSIAITNPPNGALFTAPALVVLGAVAADSDGDVTNVEFFNGSTSLGSDALPPYVITAGPLSSGIYTFAAVATDNEGARATNTVIVTVNDPPSITIFSPPSGATFAAPASFQIEATALDSDGTISQVEFFNGTKSLGLDPTSPYAVAVGPLPAGTFTFSAVATDDWGATATNAVSVTITNSPAQGVVLSSPAVTGETVVFSFPTELGHDYAIESTTSLSLTNWQVITNFSGNGSTVTFQQAVTSSQQFYRVTADR